MDEEQPGSEKPPETVAVPLIAPFGAWLKNERVKRKISLEEVAAVTKVHIQQLRALEDDEHTKLPAPAFVRGFLVSYARHLALDETEVLNRYRDAKGSVTPMADRLLSHSAKRSNPAAQTSGNKVRLVQQPKFAPSPGSKEIERPMPSWLNFGNVTILTAFIGLFCLLGILVYLGRSSKSDAPNETPTEAAAETTATAEPAAPNTSATGVAPAAPTPAPQTATTPAGTLPTVAPAAPTKVAAPATPAQDTTGQRTLIATPKKFNGELRAIEQSWVNVRSDDGASRGQMLKAGDKLPFEANRKVSFSLSDAGAVEIFWDGVVYQGPGSRGDVRTLTLPDQLDTLKVKPAPKPKPRVVAPPVAPATEPATPSDSGQ